MLFLDNSGARADEAAQLLMGDIDTVAHAMGILGKGCERGQCPLWPRTVAALNPLIADRTWCDGESVSQSLQASDHPVWHLRHGPALRVEVEKRKSVKSQEAHQPTQHPSFDRLPLASSGSRYQHNTRMAWPRLTRYDERVRRDRP